MEAAAVLGSPADFGWALRGDEMTLPQARLMTGLPPVRAENPVTVSEQQVPGSRPQHRRPDQSQHHRPRFPSDWST
jgi:hypothetical protein